VITLFDRKTEVPLSGKFLSGSNWDRIGEGHFRSLEDERDSQGKLLWIANPR